MKIIDHAIKAAGSAEKYLDEVRSVLTEALQLGARAAPLQMDTPLLGDIPELDSMAIVTVLTALEEHYGFFIEDDEISGETFETLGTLVEFVANKAES